MKRTIYIQSIEHTKEGESGLWYSSVNQNAQYIFNLMKNNSVSCEFIDQFNDAYWRLEIKGRKKNVRNFISVLTLATSEIYNIREYW